MHACELALHRACMNSCIGGLPPQPMVDDQHPACPTHPPLLHIHSQAGRAPLYVNRTSTRQWRCTRLGRLAWSTRKRPTTELLLCDVKHLGSM
eukprot:12274-Chlamydomonas_euryale.AAC.8